MNKYRAFATDVTAFLSAVEKVGNPFEDESADLFVLDTKDFVSTEVVDTVKNITHIGERQYDEFVKERLQERCKAVTEPLTKNKLPLFGTPVQKVTKQTGRLSALKNDCALFSRLLASVVMAILKASLSTRINLGRRPFHRWVR